MRPLSPTERRETPSAMPRPGGRRAQNTVKRGTFWRPGWSAAGGAAPLSYGEERTAVRQGHGQGVGRSWFVLAGMAWVGWGRSVVVWASGLVGWGWSVVVCA